MAEHVSPRVNSARLGDYVGRVVRLPCKLIRVAQNSAIVEATDGGQVEVETITDHQLEPYDEIIGMVKDANKIRMQACIGFENDFDMKLANDAIELSHSPEYASMF